MDVYDSFRPLAIVSRALGYLPVGNTTSKPYRRLWFFSLFGPIILLTINLLWHLIEFNENNWADWKVPSSNISFIVVMEYFVVNLTIVITYVVIELNFGRISDLISKLNGFDGAMKGNTDINSWMRKAAWIYLGTFVGLIVIQFVLDCAEMKTLTFHNVFNTIIFLPYVLLIQVVFFSESIRLRFASVKQEIRQVIQTMPSSFPSSDKQPAVEAVDESLLQPLSRLSGAFDDLCQSVSRVNRSYGLGLAALYLYLVIEILVESFYQLAVPGDFGEVDFGTFRGLFLLGCRIFVIWCVTCMLERLPNEASSLLLDLRKVDLTSLEANDQMVIRDLISKVTHPPVEISAWFFRVRSGIIATVTGLIVTYLIILSQPKLTRHPE